MLTPDLLVLLAATLSALQIVTLIVRREHVDEAPYLGLLVADLAALAWAHLAGHPASAIAFVGEAVAVVLTFAPRILDGAEQGALARDELHRAERVAWFRALLMPGRAAQRRHRRLRDLALARSGGAQAVIRRLRAEVEEARGPEAALALREELATVLFFDQRFSEGVAEVERHLGLAYVQRRPVFAAYLLRAYGELGRLGHAAAVMALIEDGPAGRDPHAAILLAQARITFLAFSGAVEHVEALLAGQAGSALPEHAHQLLTGIARARAHRIEIEPLAPEVRALGETIFSRATLPRPVETRAPRRAPATWALIAANTAVFVAVLALLPDADGGALVRAGALFRPATLGGEWWRLYTGMFLHAGWLHLGINMYGLYLLGRFTEEVFGTVRYLVVYFLSGLCGALSSTLVGAGALSVGASGAIMGLLGALIVLLVLKRGSWPERWRKTLLWNLVLLGALQIYIGFAIPMIDNAAHVGGMLGGAAATLLFAPGGLVGSGRGGRALSRGLAALLLAGALVAGALQARTPLGRTLARLPTHEVKLAGALLDVPDYWELDPEHAVVGDPYLDIKVVAHTDGGRVQLASSSFADPRYQALLAKLRDTARVDPAPVRRGD
jgi:membrane associated rhomboid family serine protease